MLGTHLMEIVYVDIELSLFRLLFLLTVLVIDHLHTQSLLCSYSCPF